MRLPYHATTSAQLSAARSNPGGYIFYGRNGMGKLEAARELARSLNCLSPLHDECPICRRFAAGSFADFILVEPDEKQSVSVEQIRELTQNLSLRSYSQEAARFVVIDQGHRLTVQAQNALLKLIEEPPYKTRVIILTERLEPLLATVRSRLGLIYFAPVSKEVIMTFLKENASQTEPEVELTAELAHGAPRKALELLKSSELRMSEMSHAEQAKAALSGNKFDRLTLAKRLAEAKDVLDWWADSLEAEITARIMDDRAPQAEAARQLAAVELFRKQLKANVGARAAAERMVLEL